MRLGQLLTAVTTLTVPLTLAAPLRFEARTASDLCADFRLDGERLDETSLQRCRYLLSESDLHPFLKRWKNAGRAAEKVLDQLTEKLRFERKKRDLADEICETLVDYNSTTNVLSDNEIAGVEYEGAGLLEGVDLNLNPSILSGIFQTATASPTASTTVTLTMSASPAATTRPHRSTFPERKSALSASVASAAAAEASARNEPAIDIEIEGQGLLDGVDLTVKPEFLNSLLQPRTVAAMAVAAERTGYP